MSIVLPIQTEILTRTGYRKAGDITTELVAVPSNSDLVWAQANVAEHPDVPCKTVSFFRKTKTINIDCCETNIFETNKRHDQPIPNIVSVKNISTNVVVKTLQQSPFSGDLSKDGIRSGIIFGDGSVGGSGTVTSITLFGPKEELAEWFPDASCKIDVNCWSGGNALRLGKLPASLKKLPSLDNSYDFLAGWLAGLIATDGCVRDSGVILANRDLFVIERIIEICQILGIHVGRSTEMKPGKTTFGNGAWSTRIDNVPEEWFIRSDQRAKFAEKPLITRRWKITEVSNSFMSKAVVLEGIDSVCISEKLILSS